MGVAAKYFVSGGCKNWIAEGWHGKECRVNDDTDSCTVNTLIYYEEGRPGKIRPFNTSYAGPFFLVYSDFFAHF